MATVQELVALGEKMQLQGDELKAFITEQQALAREERQKERERESLLKDYEARERDRERDEKERSQEGELRQLELQIKLEEAKGHRASGNDSRDDDGNTDDDNTDGIIPGQSRKIRGPKMSKFTEHDNMDSYLHRFERYAELQKWKKEQWAVYLAALLTGTALNVYARLPPEQSGDYAVLKAALLKRYQMTEEGYKQRFYEGKSDKGETPSQFITRLNSYLLRWLELAEVEQTFDGLRSLIVRERFLSSCPKSLELFLRERAVVDLTELGKLAEQFESAHENRAYQKRDVATTNVEQISDVRQQAGTQNNRPPNNATQAKRCYVCHRIGHIAKNCFHRQRTAGITFDDRWNDTNNQSGNYNFASYGQPPVENQMRAALCQHQCTNECHGNSAAPDGHACNALLNPQVELRCGCTVPVLAEACQARNIQSSMPVTTGSLFEREVQVLRDTGCSTVVVRRDLVPDDRLTGKTVLCVLIDGTGRRFPTAKIDIKTPYGSGTVEAVCMKRPMYDLIIGNVTCLQNRKEQTEEKAVNTDEVQSSHVEQLQAVTTRAQSKQNTQSKPLKVSSEIDCNVTASEMVQLQRRDETLKDWWDKAENKDNTTEGNVGVVFHVKKDILYRKKEVQGKLMTQLAVPQQLREKVMRLAHDSILSGHQGIKKTYERVTAHFFWPGVHGDVVRYCRSCDTCQRTIAKGRVPKVPLGKLPLIELPFKRVAVDLVGPIAPASERGNRYILCMVDYATRYPEAIALKNIDTETVAEALVIMFTRVGVPQEILTDQGTQFMSSVMKEASRLLSLTQLTTSPYHPMCNGLVERFNGTLKTMLKRMCAEKPKDWDRYLPAVLFAYREVPQESLGFSPFELLYGRTVRGPMAILKDVWTKQETEPEIKLTYQYVLELQERLEETCHLARQELAKAQGIQKRHFDVKARDRQFNPGEKVLLLLPTDNNKLLMQWKGPFEVLERKGDNNYRIQLPERIKLFHANMLKKYHERKKEDVEAEALGAVLIESTGDDEVETFVELPMRAEETYRDVHVNPELDEEKRKQVEALLVEFQDVFTDVPKVTNLGKHQIQLTSHEPVRSKPYPLPFAIREAVDKEIDSMIELGVIEPSTAPYASPIVAVKKPDGSIRVCVDYRKLNKVTTFDPEPMPQTQDIFSDLAGSQYYSKFDFCKGYWQVPMDENDRDLTTFVTHRGLFRFRVMPFGLVNAPATFSRIMRKLLDKLAKLLNYLDDVLAHTREWPDHLTTLRRFLERVRSANLALRPSKCFIGFCELTFLGHQLGPNGLSPMDTKVDKIMAAPAPTTKKQLRSFLGLIGYYRSYVPNFAAIAVPLTDLTRKGAPNNLVWTEAQERAFQSLKRYVCNPPILRLPDVSKPFILQTDASNEGIGAILLQDVDGIKHPVAFASKKLLPRETKYSTVEREALAIVWGVQKFHNYLFGQHFVLETDHHPLQYLNQTKFQNNRVMRWSLVLQPYRFTVRSIKGCENVGADFLSRHAC